MAGEYEEKESAGEEEKDEDILEDARKYVAQCIDDEDVEREKMRDDLRFCTLDQWPEDIRNDREGDVENGPRPCLTIDKINQYIVQVVNDMRQGKPGINVRPQDDEADVETAKVLKGIVRNIEDQSSADIAYATAGENAAKIGLGYFRILPEYIDDESFDQALFIRPIPNTFTTYLGPHIMPDGSDAERGFIMEAMPLEKFKQENPKAKCTSQDFDGIDSSAIGHWLTQETITVVEEYVIKKTNETLHYLADGTTISEDDYKNWPKAAGVKPTIRESRTTTRKQLKWRKMTGAEVLDKRDLPGKYIPIVEVVGRETWVDGKRVLWGLVRPAKDSLRMYNYWASTITEKMGLAPKNPYIGAKGQFEGLDANWKKANRKNFAYLEYNPIDVNGNAIPAPQRQGATPMEAAYFHFMQVIEHDVQTSLGMFKAAVGETESQQSGRAILALQRESDTGTYHFGANLGVSIRHAGRIIVDLIPHYYDTKRIVRILGEDGEVQQVQLDPNQQVAHQKVVTDQSIQSIHNPGIGQYDVSIMSGPSYNTKRMENAATFVEMSKGAADPASAAILRYLVMRNSDFPGAEEAAKLLKSMLPPQALQSLSSNEPVPPQIQAQMQQMQQKMQQMSEMGQKLQQENIQYKANAQTKAMEIQARQQEARAKFSLQAQEMKHARDAEIASMALERERAQNQMALESAKAKASIELEAMKAAAEEDRELRKAALDAAVKLEIARINASKDAAEGVTPTAGGQTQDIMLAILGKQQQLLDHAKAPKKHTIELVKRDGATVGANVTVQ